MIADWKCKECGEIQEHNLIYPNKPLHCGKEMNQIPSKPTVVGMDRFGRSNKISKK